MEKISPVIYDPCTEAEAAEYSQIDELYPLTKLWRNLQLMGGEITANEAIAQYALKFASGTADSAWISYHFDNVIDSKIAYIDAFKIVRDLIYREIDELMRRRKAREQDRRPREEILKEDGWEPAAGGGWRRRWAQETTRQSDKK